jgi:6-phosphogluconolactonase/glucosamine-6-phosphate isomerase/deaminase
VAAIWAQHLRAARITLTPAAILNARAIIVLASGPAKAAAVEAAIEKPLNIHRWPAQMLREAGTRVTWMVDEDAAALLSRGGPPA